MSKVLKSIYRKILSLRNELKWKIEYQFEMNCNDLEPPEILPRLYNKQLVIVPHSDDELFGAYALRQLQGDRLYLLYCGMTGSNQSKENSIARRAEFVSYTEVTKTLYFELNEIKDLLQIITDNDIQTVYLPSLIDWHEEHRDLNKFLYDTIVNSDRHLKIYWYSITVPIMAKGNRFIAPMSEDEQKQKYKLFKQIYKTQGFMPINRFKFNERLNAKGTDLYAGEVFLSIEYEAWCRWVRKFYYSERKNSFKIFNDLKGNINSIKNVRRQSYRLYKILDQREVV